MRLVFVTPRFRAGDATSPERLAAELAGRAPDSWRTTVVTTTAAGPSEEAFRDGEIQDKGVRVVRFPAAAAASAKPPGSTGADSLTSPDLLAYLRDRSGDYDLVVLFGSSSVCREAAKLDPRRAVLLPFADAEAAGANSEIFQHPAAFVFGSEAEEILVLKRYQVHRRMRETVTGTLLLPRTADVPAFRRRAGVSANYLISAVPLEPGRGIEELLRFYSTFKDRHPDVALELVLIGPSALRLPQRPDIHVVQPDTPGARFDAVGGALVAVIPERLAAFSTTAAEPFSLGVPILANASATELADDCRTSGGGLYYQNYDEFELILELGLRDPSLFARMGAAGREFLQSRHDWDSVLTRYDRAFRSFARPSRSAAGGGAPPEVAPAPEQEPPPAPEAAAEAATPTSRSEEPVSESPETGEELSAGPDGSEEIPPVIEPATPPEPAVGEPEESGTSPAAASEEDPPLEAASEAEAPDEEQDEQPAASEGEPEPAEADDADEAAAPEARGDSLPSFFRGSIRD